MAVQPLFIADMDRLISAIRLSGATQPDTLEAIDRALQEVRIGFYDRLGASRIAVIVAYSRTDNPSTADEVMRKRAEIAEGRWVKVILMRELPTLFMDSASNTEQRWNEESLTRESGGRPLDRMIEKLEQEVEEALIALADNAPEKGKSSVTVVGPTTIQPRPFDSILRGYN